MHELGSVSSPLRITKILLKYDFPCIIIFLELSIFI